MTDAQIERFLNSLEAIASMVENVLEAEVGYMEIATREDVLAEEARFRELKRTELLNSETEASLKTVELEQRSRKLHLENLELIEKESRL